MRSGLHRHIMFLGAIASFYFRLCAETSWSGNRILETGDERFLEGKLYDQKKGGGFSVPTDELLVVLPLSNLVPLIVVFTKYDLLVASKEMEIIKSGIATAQNWTDQDVAKAANAYFENKCSEVIPSDIKYTKVSSELLSSIVIYLDHRRRGLLQVITKKL